MLQNSRINTRRSCLAALCLTATLGIGQNSHAQAPVMDPKIPVLKKINKSAPDLISPTLTVQLHTAAATLPADETIKLPGSSKIFTVGKRINDDADRVAHPEAALENVLDNKREFEIPVTLKQPESGRYFWSYQSFGENDIGHAVTALVSPSLAILSSNYARTGNRAAHGVQPMTIVCSQTEVVNTQDCTAYGVRIYGVKQDRYVGKDKEGDSSHDGPYTHMIGTTLTVVQRSFSSNSNDGEAVSLTVHRIDPKLAGMYSIDGVQNPKAKAKDKEADEVSLTAGELNIYLVSRNDGTVEGFGSWLKAKEALPPKFVEFFSGDLKKLVDRATLDNFFGPSVPPRTELVKADGPDRFSGKPMAPVDIDSLRTEGAAYMITSAHYTANWSATLGVFSPGFSPDAVRKLQDDATKPGPMTPWLLGTDSKAKVLREARIGDMVVQHDPSIGFATRALVCGTKGYVPAHLSNKQGSKGLLLDAAAAAFGRDLGDKRDLGTIWVEQMMGLLGTNPDSERAKLNVEYVGQNSTSKQSSRAGSNKKP